MLRGRRPVEALADKLGELPFEAAGVPEWLDALPAAPPSNDRTVGAHNRNSCNLLIRIERAAQQVGQARIIA